MNYGYQNGRLNFELPLIDFIILCIFGTLGIRKSELNLLNLGCPWFNLQLSLVQRKGYPTIYILHDIHKEF